MADSIYISLETAVVSDSFKMPDVQAGVKQPELDACRGPDILLHRPASNLSYLSKKAGRVVASGLQLADHMAEFDFYDPHQSAYRPCHSCEAALIHVQNEIHG